MQHTYPSTYPKSKLKTTKSNLFNQWNLLQLYIHDCGEGVGDQSPRDSKTLAILKLETSMIQILNTLRANCICRNTGMKSIPFWWLSLSNPLLTNMIFLSFFIWVKHTECYWCHYFEKCIIHHNQISSVMDYFRLHKSVTDSCGFSSLSSLWNIW